MTLALIIVNLLLLALVIPLAVNVLRIKYRKRQRGIFRRWPVRQCSLQEFDKVFVPGPFGPTLATEVHFVASGPFTVPGGTTDVEAWILAVFAKRAKTLFEFGTCTGKTTYLWARNSPPDAHITTLTLAPDSQQEYACSPGDDPAAAGTALAESRFTHFMYSGTEVEGKITQMYGDSKALDEAPFAGRCDLVFVDGSHAYSYVVSDSQKALQMVRPGGIVLWHDYDGPHWLRDVYRALNELSKTLPLVHIKGTRLVAYRKPATAEAGAS
jgi:hypothetical protein